MRHFSLIGLALLLGCSAELDSTNPYDPATPAASQAPASVAGRLELPKGYEAEVFGEAAVHLRELVADAEPRSTAVDEEGSFAFTDVTPGRYRVQAQVPGLVSPDTLIELGVGEALDLGRVDLAVTGEAARFGRVSGVASVSGGSGVPVHVIARATAFGARVSAEGTYALDLPGRAEPYTLEFSAEGSTLEQVDVSVGEGDSITLDPIVLGALPGSVHGRVELEVLDLAEQAANITLAFEREGEVEHTTPVLEDGRFAQEVAPGSWRLRISLRGFAEVDTEVLVEPGRPSQIGTLRLRASRRSSRARSPSRACRTTAAPASAPSRRAWSREPTPRARSR